MSPYAYLSKALHFSQSPEVKLGQVNILAEMFQMLACGDDSSKSNLSLVTLLSETPEVTEAVDKMLKGLPETPSPGTFDDMLKLRDSSGLLRRPP